MHGWGATSISGDHLGEDEESPSPERDGCIGLDGLIQPNASGGAGPLGGGRPMVSIFENLAWIKL